MESRFEADFSQVRVHTGGEAVQMNRDLNAQAFTRKQDVYFGAGKAPGKNALTAHELTHVVQQTGGADTRKTSTLSVQLKCLACEKKEADVQRASDLSPVSETIQRREVCEDEGVCRPEPDQDVSSDQNYTPAPYLPYKSNDQNETPDQYKETGQLTGDAIPKTQQESNDQNETPDQYKETGQLTGDAIPKTQQDGSFNERFKKCLEQAGVPVLDSPFKTAASATATVTALAKAIDGYVKVAKVAKDGLTIARLIEAGVLSEVFAPAAGLIAATYLMLLASCAAEAKNIDPVSF